MIVYYQESNDDYLAIDTSTNTYYRKLGWDNFEGRATAIVGQVGSVCTTGISREYLRTNCKRVARAIVPVEWRHAIRLEESVHV